MKIIFICGSFEPGFDGVGDYTRRLAIELIRIGHEAKVIAINDKYQSHEFIGTQELESAQLEVFRIPAHYKEKDRYRSALSYINENNPDWLSLQFVPFSFHQKGLPLQIGRQMRKIGNNRPWHVMFHELWLGMSIDSSFAKLIWGWLQKKIIYSLVLNIKPKAIHTQCNLYKVELEQIGIQSTVLPLFSNIPPSKSIRQVNETKIAFDKSNCFNFIVFGSIHPDAPIDKLALEAASFSKKRGVEITLTIIGRCGLQQERWVQVWKSKGLPVRLLGEQSFEMVSEELYNALVGISTTSISVIEKSGSVAAMREHGLPVLVVARSWEPRVSKCFSLPNGVIAYREGILEELIIKYQKNKDKLAPTNGVSVVSKQLLEELSTIR